MPAGNGLWHVPGEGAVTEAELFRRAKKRRVHCCLFIREREGAIHDERL